MPDSSFKVSLGQAQVTPPASSLRLSKGGLCITVSSPDSLENIQVEVTQDPKVPATNQAIVHARGSDSRFFRALRAGSYATVLVGFGSIIGVGAGGMWSENQKEKATLSTPIPENKIPDINAPLLKAPTPLYPPKKENPFDPKSFNQNPFKDGIFDDPFIPKKNEIRDLGDGYGGNTPEFKPLDTPLTPQLTPQQEQELLELEELLDNMDDLFSKKSLIPKQPPPSPLEVPKLPPLKPSIVYQGLDPSALSEKNLQKRESLYKAIQEASEPQKKPLIAKYAKPAVVSISMSASNFGSGWICHSDDKGSLIVTNRHVVKVPGTEIVAGEVDVTLINGKKVTGKVIESDKSRDLALIKIDEKNLPVLKPSEIEPEEGESVIAIGNPGSNYNSLGWSITSGIISAKDRIRNEYGLNNVKTIQTDTAINPGNSGGPLLNMNGDVIAVNTLIQRAYGYEGVAFSIPVKYAKDLLDKH